ncbi:cationic outer membrane protein OmpH [gut metagenome]|uniref:Cationic outer membrane protein OmpH n=1 Tax=gut metagenome TaxID=749906 RepID=J9GPD9_9ZZZZ
MKKSLFLVCALLTINFTAQAQKFALIDMEYIFQHIPEYGRANEQLNQSSKQWQNEVEKLSQEAKDLYQNYQQSSRNLSEAQKRQKENAIVTKEKSAVELRRKYFGPEGELAKKQQTLLKPIEDKIYEAVKQIATQRGYAAVLDRASANSIIFASPSIDISNEVLTKLGYSN